MARGRTWALISGLAVSVMLLLVGCSRQSKLVCSGDSIYLEARSVGELRIPDDLSIPDETETLRIPRAPANDNAAGSEQEECLEVPPALRQASRQPANQQQEE